MLTAAFVDGWPGRQAVRQESSLSVLKLRPCAPSMWRSLGARAQQCRGACARHVWPPCILAVGMKGAQGL